MTDARIATDYLDSLFAKLAAGDLDPARVDWPFAAECWRAVRGEVERLDRVHATIERWRREADDLEERAVRHYDVACLSDGDRCTERAKELRFRAAEVERALGGEHENLGSGGGK